MDANGLHTLPSKVAAIVQAPDPENESQLQSFLGIVEPAIIPNLGTIVHPQNWHLRQEAHWKWMQECAEAFQQAKKSLISSQVSAHYDINLPIKLATDTSAYEIGTVTSHVNPDGSKWPVAFTSTILITVQWTQLEKEASSLVYGVNNIYMEGCFHR